jgi:hypothetical protein
MDKTSPPYFAEDQKARLDELNRIARGDPKPPTVDEVPVTAEVSIERLEIGGGAIWMTGSVNGSRFRGAIAQIVDLGRPYFSGSWATDSLVMTRPAAEALVEEWNRNRP